MTRLERKVEIALKENLLSEILESEAFLVLTIVASVEGDSSLIGSTVVVVTLPEREEQENAGK